MAAVLFLVGSVGIGCPVGDLDGNCRVDFGDISIFARQWLEDGTCSEPNCANLDGLGAVSMADFALLASTWLEDQTGLVISEFMAVNNDTLADEEGRFRDWIEIYNPMDITVDLEGWYLTDNDSNLAKWQFPADVEIRSGEFLVVFASGNDPRDPNNPLHTNFKLDGGGDEGDVVLVAPDGATIAHEYLDYPKQLGDISYGLMQYARTLVAGGDTVSYHVPTGSDAGADWTAVDFNDSTWETGPTGLNFGFGGQQRVSYNDCVFEGGQHKAEHVTEYGIGSGFGGDTSGPLVDQATGEPTGATATFEQSGGVNWQPDPRNGGSDCAAGTDAYNTFGNFADMTGVIYYGSTGWWIDLTFTGLDPSIEYTFATSAARNNYTGRLTRYTITGADTYTNASSTTPSPGVIEIPGSAGSSVRFNTGHNHNEGYVARWTGIRASDGTFKVRAEADPDNPSGSRAYSFDVFMLKGGFGGTNVQDQMKGVNASLWSRAEFYLEQGEREIFEKLTLRMKYEDGFVAYLNGQKVAWRNDPNSLQWNSTAPTNRPIEEAAAFEPINLTAYMDLLQDGRNVLAIHALNDGKSDNEFLVLPELIAASGAGVPQYFTTPTPRTFNVAGTKGPVSEVWFSHKRGFYNSPFDLTLSTEMSGAEIRYTTDGSRPTTTNGSTYTPGSPIRIHKTTPLRAVALRPGYLDSKVETHTYVFLSDVITQSLNGEKPSPDWPSDGLNGQRFEYGMDSYIVNHGTWGPLLDDALISIPTMSIVTDLDNLFNPSRSSATGGIYVNAGQHGRAWERPTSLELVYPPNPQGPGFPDLVQVPDSRGELRWELPRKMQGGFQTNAGLRIRGGFSRSGGNPKHAFRVFFRSEYRDGELEYPLFGSEGAESFDKVDLRTSQNYSWSFQNDGANTMCRDVWARDTQGLMGHPYTRSRYYHLYINGHYWGIFQTQERSEASYGESYFGGSQDEYDTVKATGPNAGYTIEATDGNLDAWRELWDLANLGFGSDATYYRAQGLNPDGTRNLSYPVLLDVDNLIDYMLQVFYDGDRDAPISNFLSNTRTNNWFSVRSRTGDEGFRYFVHDAEHIMSRGLTNRTGPYPCGDQFQYSNPQWIHQELMAHPDYRMRFADHAQKHLFNNGLLTASKAIERFRSRADQIDIAIIAESARWGSSSLNKSTWEGALRNEIDWFFPNRSETIVSQLKNTRLRSGASAPLYPSVSAPSFNHLGGPVPKDYPLTMSGVGTVYYTLDGTDPRLAGGAVNTDHAKTYSTAINLTATTHVKARAQSGRTWSALNEAVFAVGPVADNLRITEIMYHPQDIGDPNDPNEEFIELKNISDEPMNLNLVRFTNGIDFTFPSWELGKKNCVLVVKDRAAFDAQYPGLSSIIAGEYTGSLDNGGERIELADAIGRTIQDFKYGDDWRPITDGGGFSLTIIDPVNGDPYSWGEKDSWRASAYNGGSPGEDDNGIIPNPGAVVINELLAHSPGTLGDWIELYNTTDAQIDIGGWYLSDSNANLMKYRIADGTEIDSGEYLVFYEDGNFGEVSTDPGKKVGFALSENEGAVYLSSAEGDVLMGYREAEDFGASGAGVSFGRYFKRSTGNYNFVAMSVATPWLPNAYPKVGPIVINEIMYNPQSGDQRQEYIELHNIGPTDVTLYDPNEAQPWRFTDGIDYTFGAAPGITIPVGGYLLVVKDMTAYLAEYGIPPSGVVVLGPYNGNLSNAGEKLELSKPGDVNEYDTRHYIRVDRVNYSDGLHPEDCPGGVDLWPTEPDGGGKSLTRTIPPNYGNDPNNWIAAMPSPGE